MSHPPDDRAAYRRWLSDLSDHDLALEVTRQASLGDAASAWLEAEIADSARDANAELTVHAPEFAYAAAADGPTVTVKVERVDEGRWRLFFESRDASPTWASVHIAAEVSYTVVVPLRSGDGSEHAHGSLVVSAAAPPTARTVRSSSVPSDLSEEVVERSVRESEPWTLAGWLSAIETLPNHVQDIVRNAAG